MDFAKVKSRFENLAIVDDSNNSGAQKKTSWRAIQTTGKVGTGSGVLKEMKKKVSEKIDERNASGASVPMSAVSSEPRRSSGANGVTSGRFEESGSGFKEMKKDGETLEGHTKNLDELEDEGDRDEDDDEEWESGSATQESDVGSEGLVRQESNFSRLSAQSWESVESTEMIEDDDGWKVAEGAAGDGARGVARVLSNGGRDVSGVVVSSESARESGGRRDVLQAVKGKPVRSRTVLECAVELLGGMAALKKKTLGRFGMRRVWLSDDCSRLFWTSKKMDVEVDYIKLARISKVRLQERELVLETASSQRKIFVFENEESAQLWTRFLGCFAPLQAKVKAPDGIILRDKELEDYDIGEDSFDRKPLRQLKSVNDYVVLGNQKGFDGEVKLALSRATRTFVGMRYVSPRIAPLLIRSAEEIALLKHLDHPNILRYRECLVDARGGNYVLFDYAPRGPIMDLQDPRGVHPIKEGLARELVRDIISALEYLHGLRIAHGDIRPQNLVRGVDGTVKLNPLGCITYDYTEVKNHGDLLQARLGNERAAFIAPEMCWLSSKKPRGVPGSYAMDIWSLGAVLFFMLYGRIPFDGKTPQAIQDNICTGKLRFPRNPKTTRKVMNFLKGVLGEKDPKARIRLSGLKNHPWLADGLDPVTAADMRVTPPAPSVLVPEEEVEQAVGRAKVRLPY